MINIYVANLGKYNEGILQGEWFTLPASLEEIAEKIGLNAQYEEYAIHDYEAPFKIEEYTSIDKLNEVAEMLEGMAEYEIKAVGELLELGFVSDYEDAVQLVKDGAVTFFHDCYNMADVAYAWYEETGQMENIPSNLINYIDWDAVGRDMEINGTFAYLGNGIYMEVLQ